MKLIIDIPNEAYNILTEYQVLPENLDLEYFVIHGIPLEEELEKIKAEIMSIGNWREHYEMPIAYLSCLNIVENHISELKGE